MNSSKIQQSELGLGTIIFRKDIYSLLSHNKQAETKQSFQANKYNMNHNKLHKPSTQMKELMKAISIHRIKPGLSQRRSCGNNECFSMERNRNKEFSGHRPSNQYFQHPFFGLSRVLSPNNAIQPKQRILEEDEQAENLYFKINDRWRNTQRRWTTERRGSQRYGERRGSTRSGSKGLTWTKRKYQKSMKEINLQNNKIPRHQFNNGGVDKIDKSQYIRGLNFLTQELNILKTNSQTQEINLTHPIKAEGSSNCDSKIIESKILDPCSSMMKSFTLNKVIDSEKSIYKSK